MKHDPKRLYLVTIPGLCLVLLLAGVSQGSSVAIPNTFTAGTTAEAAQVNANFAAVAAAVNDNHTRITTLENGRTQVFASTDNNSPGVSVTSTGQKEMNSVTFTVPTDGFLLVSGTVFINNNSPTTSYAMTCKLDGVNQHPGGFITTFAAAADGAFVAELFTLNYTTAFPVTAGLHTVSQTAGPNTSTADFFHNAEKLTVTYIANGTVTPTTSPPLISGDAPLSELGD